MRLSLKIAALIGLGSTLLVVIVSLLSLRRDVEIIEADIERDARKVASALALAVENLDPEETKQLIERVNATTYGMHVQWLEKSKELDSEVSLWDHEVVVSLPIGDRRLVVAETLQPRQQFIEGAVRSLALSSTIIMLLSLTGGLWLGRWIVGRRVDALVEKARRVAKGEFDQPVRMSGADELNLIADELNLMAEQLLHARRRSEEAHEGRLQAEIQLRHADRLRTVGQLSAGIAHELGTPLNVIAGQASLLLRQMPEDSDEAANLTTIRTQAVRITEIVRRLMDFSRRSPSEKRPVNFTSEVASAISLLRSTVMAQGTELKVVLSEVGLVSADVEQLRQVVTNLVLNAAQALEEGGQIDVRLRLDGQGVRLEVHDDGPGIPEEDLERVLEPFFTTKEPGYGTGLGLAVVEGIVRDHGGHLSIDRSPLGGALVVVWLPAEETS